MPPRRLSLLFACAIAALAVGCDTGPTYPSARLTESLQQVLREEHFDRASVRLIDHTVAVQLEHPEALQEREGQIGIGPAFEETVRKLLIGMHRVLLSSDANVRFYVLLLSDPKLPGAYLTIVRNVDDVRRANAMMIDSTEMFYRTVFKFNYAGPAPLTLEQYIPQDIQLEEFLSWQMAQRIQYALITELQAQGIAKVGRCGGRFQNGEFAFTLDVAPMDGAALDEATMRRIFHTSTNVIAKVLSSYGFDEFQQVRLVHLSTGRNVVLPKANLDVFR